jgi:hypothetical protein
LETAGKLVVWSALKWVLMLADMKVLAKAEGSALESAAKLAMD